MKKLRDLTNTESEEFWKSLIEEGRPITFYAKKYKTSVSAINNAYNKMRDKYINRK